MAPRRANSQLAKSTPQSLVSAAPCRPSAGQPSDDGTPEPDAGRRGIDSELGLVGIVLGAGAGRRMGGPKVLLTDPRGKTLGQQHAERLIECGCDVVLLMVPPRHASLVLARGPLGPAESDRIEVIEANTTSPAETLLEAQHRLPALRACFITPVDLAPVALTTAARLLAGLHGRTLAVTPSYKGRGGHPVLLASRALPRRTPGAPARPLRDVLRALGPARQRLDVDDPSILSDWDRPAELSHGFRRASSDEDPPAVR